MALPEVRRHFLEPQLNAIPTMHRLEMALVRGDLHELRRYFARDADTASKLVNVPLRSGPCQGMLPLHAAVWTKAQVEIIDLLLEAGARPDQTCQATINYSPGNCLHLAATNNYSDAVSRILNHSKWSKMKIDAVDEWGFTPLIRAIHYGNGGIVRTLLNHGADLHLTVNKAPKDLSKIKKKDKEKPEAKKQQVDKNGNPIRVDDDNDKEEDLTDDSDAEDEDETHMSASDNMTCLHIAVLAAANFTRRGMNYVSQEPQSLYAAVETLLKAGADVNAKDSSGATPVHLAASHGVNDLLYLMLNERVVLECRDSVGYTALHCAAFNNRTLAIKLLLQRGFDINVGGGTYGETPIMAAAIQDSDAATKLLHKMGADLMYRDDNGSTVLHHAAAAGAYQCVHYLMQQYDLDIDARNKNGGTALHSLAGNVVNLKYDTWSRTARLVVEMGISQSAQDNHGLRAYKYLPHVASEAHYAFGKNPLYKAHVHHNRLLLGDKKDTRLPIAINGKRQPVTRNWLQKMKERYGERWEAIYKKYKTAEQPWRLAGDERKTPPPERITHWQYTEDSFPYDEKGIDLVRREEMEKENNGPREPAIFIPPGPDPLVEVYDFEPQPRVTYNGVETRFSFNRPDVGRDGGQRPPLDYKLRPNRYMMELHNPAPLKRSQIPTWYEEIAEEEMRQIMIPEAVLDKNKRTDHFPDRPPATERPEPKFGLRKGEFAFEDFPYQVAQNDGWGQIDVNRSELKGRGILAKAKRKDRRAPPGGMPVKDRPVVNVKNAKVIRRMAEDDQLEQYDQGVSYRSPMLPPLDTQSIGSVSTRAPANNLPKPPKPTWDGVIQEAIRQMAERRRIQEYGEDDDQDPAGQHHDLVRNEAPKHSQDVQTSPPNRSGHSRLPSKREQQEQLASQNSVEHHRASVRAPLSLSPTPPLPGDKNPQYSKAPVPDKARRHRHEKRQPSPHQPRKHKSKEKSRERGHRKK